MRISLLMLVLIALSGATDASADRRGRDRSREEPQCVSAYGRTACGFSCVAAYGVVRCADTSAGRCEAAYGKVECWDPAPWVFSRYRRVPQAQCISAYGEIACGYGCEAAYGEVACAGSPGGQCVAAYGEVTCSR